MRPAERARLRNPTRALLIEALGQAKVHAKTRDSGDYSRGVLAFVSGYCSQTEPEIAAAIDEILKGMFEQVSPATEPTA